jgi:YHS domain-containing protein
MVAMGMLMAGVAYAASEEAGGAGQQETQVFVDVGNKICPLTGEGVDGKTYAVYKGRRYGLCCQECGANFWQDPETYSMLAEKEVSGRK